MSYKTWNEIEFSLREGCKLTKKVVKQTLVSELNKAGIIGNGNVFDKNLNTLEWFDTSELDEYVQENWPQIDEVSDSFDVIFSSISQQLPEVLITIKSENFEEAKWCNYYLNGKYHYAESKLVYAEFDPQKLEQIK
jgi:hypothetical protein